MFVIVQQVTSPAMDALFSHSLYTQCLIFVMIISVYGNIYSGYGNNKFSTKTAYFWTHPEQTSNVDGLMKIKFKGQTCEAIQLNFISRHGSRFTGDDNMDGYTKLWEKIKDHRNANDSQFTFLNSWKNKYPKENESQLTELGKSEQRYLGSMYGTELKSLLSNSGNNIRIMATSSLRTQTSGREFYGGLTKSVFGHRLADKTPIIKNNILKLYSGCYNYKTMVADNNTFIRDMYVFQNGTSYQKVIKDVEERLGLNVRLSVDDIRVLYQLSGMEISVFNDTNWSTILTDDERDVLQYGEDIEDYLVRMYGHQINSKMACPLMKDILTSMEDTRQSINRNNSYIVCDARFTHSSTMGPLFTALGLFKDSTPPRSDNYVQMKNRQFDSSKVLPMSTNVAFILYDCDNRANFVVKMHVNEQDIDIPGCTSNPCPLDDFMTLYQSNRNDCNIAKICGKVSGTNTSSANNRISMSIFIAALFLFLYGS